MIPEQYEDEYEFYFGVSLPWVKERYDSYPVHIYGDDRRVICKRCGVVLYLLCPGGFHLEREKQPVVIHDAWHKEEVHV